MKPASRALPTVSTCRTISPEASVGPDMRTASEPRRYVWKKIARRKRVVVSSVADAAR